jgi:hypothetical protein
MSLYQDSNDKSGYSFHEVKEKHPIEEVPAWILLGSGCSKGFDEFLAERLKTSDFL